MVRDVLTVEVLVGRKVGYPQGCFRLPTGGLLQGEPVEMAAHRELAEELGLAALELTHVAHIVYGHPGTPDFETFVILVAADLPSSGFQPSEELEQVQRLRVPELHLVAERLAALPAAPHRGTTWAEWGAFRAIAHRVTVDVLHVAP